MQRISCKRPMRVIAKAYSVRGHRVKKWGVLLAFIQLLRL